MELDRQQLKRLRERHHRRHGIRPAHSEAMENATRFLKRAFNIREGRAPYHVIRKRFVNGARLTGSHLCILIIAMFFQQFKDNYWVGKFFAGVRPAVVALIAAPCFKMAKTANINRYNIWIPFVCCALIAAFGISPIYIIIAAGVLGWLYGKYKKQS